MSYFFDMEVINIKHASYVRAATCDSTVFECYFTTINLILAKATTYPTIKNTAPNQCDK